MSEIQVDVGGQIVTFWIAAALGAVLCFFYDLFRILRYAHRPSKWSAFRQDVVWWFICGVLTYGLMLVRCKGVVRIFALLGEGLGFAAFRFTVSRLLLAAAKPVVRGFKAVERFVSIRILTPVWRLLRRLAEKVGTFFKKFTNFLKKHLKRLMRLLYNPHSAHTKHRQGRGMKDESGKEQAWS